MSERLQGQLSPAQKTETFWHQDVAVLEHVFSGRIIVSQEDGKMIRVDNLEGWSKEKVGNRYTKSEKNLRLTELVPGVLGVFPLPVRRMRQSLISAMSGGELGACIRLVRASSYDNDTHAFVPMPREGDIANFFGFEDNAAVKLQFMDDSEILYFNRGGDNGIRIEIPEQPNKQTEVDLANKYLQDLIK